MITPGTLAAANYAFSLVNGILTVTPAPLTAAANNATRPVGSPNPVFTGAVTGILNQDNISLDFVCNARTDSPPGEYPIVPAPKDLEGKLGNYTITVIPGVLQVTASLVITSQPQSRTVLSGTDVTFTVAVGQGALAPAYQWLFNGTPLPGETKDTLTLANVQPSQAGHYTVTVSDGSTTLTSSDATLTVLSPPAITSPIFVGNSFSMMVPTVPGLNYTLEYTDSLNPPLWQFFQRFIGDGTSDFPHPHRHAPRHPRPLLPRARQPQPVTPEPPDLGRCPLWPQLYIALPSSYLGHE